MMIVDFLAVFIGASAGLYLVVFAIGLWHEIHDVEANNE